MNPFSKKNPKPQTRDIAKDRLKLVLIHDRVNCAPETMEKLKDDLVKVISKYIDVDEEDIDIHITQADVDGIIDGPALQAIFPIKPLRRAINS